MELIPAIDLQNGTVVSGYGGERKNYQPIKSDLFPDAKPLRIIQKLSSLFDIHKIYIADLDAIEKCGNNDSIINEIKNLFPSLQILLDNGIVCRSQIKLSNRITPVVGTETLQDSLSNFQSLDYILSLDFKCNSLIGSDVMQYINFWPARIIVLSIDAIGRQNGMNFELLRTVRKRYHGSIFAGGGLNSEDDLRQLQQIGIDGVLSASALYSGKITADMFVE